MRRNPRVRAVACAAGLAACALGIIAVAVALRSPLVAVGLLAAAALGPVVVLRPKVALVALVVVELTNTSVIAGERGSVTLFGLVLTGAMASLLLGVRRGTVRLVWSPVFVGGLVYLAARAASLAVARDPSLGAGIVGGVARDLVFLFVVVVLMHSVRDHLGVVKVMVSAIALLAALSLVQEFVFHNASSFLGYSRTPLPKDLGSITVRHSGPFEDVNFWARILVLFLPLSLSLWAQRSMGSRRWVWFGAAGMIVLGTYLTQSRGGFLSLGVAAVVWLALAGGRYRRALRVVPLIAVVLLWLPGAGSRLETLSEIGRAGAEGGDPSLVGRLAAQQAGLAMFLDHPLLGVGTGNFELVEPEYQRNAGLVISRVIAPHNLYLQMAAEGGVLGLGAWLLFFAAGGVAAGRVLAAGRHGGMLPSHRLIAAGIVAGLAGWASASVFLHLGEQRILMLVLALAAALKLDAGRSDRQAAFPAEAISGSGPAGTRRHGRRPGDLRPVPSVRHWLVAASVCEVVAAAAILLWRLPAFQERTWMAEASAMVVARRSDGASLDSYDYDVLTRAFVLPTYAEIVGQPRFRNAAMRQIGVAEPAGTRLTVDASPTGALLTVSATSTDGIVAWELAQGTLDQGVRYIQSLGRLYRIEPATGSSRRLKEVRRVKAFPLIAVASIGIVGAVLLTRRRANPDPSRRPMPRPGMNGLAR